MLSQIGRRSLLTSSIVRRCAVTNAARVVGRAFASLPSDSGDGGSPPKIHNSFAGPGYDWQDPLRFRGLLTDEETAVWDMAQSFCQGELLPGICEANRHEIPCDHKMMKKMGEMGFLGATIPEYYGGAGLGYVSYGLLATEVERVDSSYRSAMSVQSSLVMYPIYAYGTEEMKQKYLPELAAGNLIGCFGLTVSIVFLPFWYLFLPDTPRQIKLKLFSSFSSPQHK